MRGWRPALVLVAALVAAGCSSASEGDAIPVVATDTTCSVGQTALAAGRHTFSVDNQGKQVTEVYVYAPGDKVAAERENIGPGTKASFSVTLAAGTYEVACKPGQTGAGIRQKVVVS